MKNPNRIYQDDKGITRFSAYFSFIDTIAKDLPERLAAFATNELRYNLNSNETLHDSWLQSFEVLKVYVTNQPVNTTVKISLLQAMHTHSIRLFYGGVTNVEFSSEPTRWPLQPVDLLVHEFDQVELGVFQHYLEFNHGVWLGLTFTSFEFDDVPI